MTTEIHIDFLEQRASELAIESHKGQFRRDGKTPYINHVGDVVNRIKGGTIRRATAWLHDVLEDTELTEDDLLAKGFGTAVVQAVSVLTKHPGEDYEDYIRNIRANPVAHDVKVADILSNLSDAPTAKQVKKYARALSILLA